MYIGPIRKYYLCMEGLSPKVVLPGWFQISLVKKTNKQKEQLAMKPSLSIAGDLSLIYQGDI